MNVSEQTSTDVSLPTKKFADRNEWLHEMSRLEDRTRSDQSFHVERPDSNRGDDAVVRSSEEELMWHERKTSRSVASTSSTDLDSFHSKSGNVKRRLASRRERNARKASYDSHAGDRRKVGQVTSSSLRSELSRLETLILKQRHRCLRRLRRQVENLERIDSAFFSLPTLSSSENESMRYRKHSNDACASDVRELSPSGKSQPPTSKVGVSVGLQTTPSLTNIANRSSDESVGWNSSRNVAVRKPVSWEIPFEQANDGAAARTEPSTVSLQKAFEEDQASLCDKIRIRHLKISQAAAERREEYARKRMLIRNAGEFGTNFVQSNSQVDQVRIIPHNEMRERTERVYQTLLEVVVKNEAKNKEKKKQEECRTNRMMATVYRKKVQEKVLRGHIRTTVSKKSCISK